jgi:hypothetical protein
MINTMRSKNQNHVLGVMHTMPGGHEELVGT